MEVILLTVIVSIIINITVIIAKLSQGGWRKKVNGLIDLSLTCLVFAFFSNSFSALAVGTVASAFISIWLIFSPVVKASA